MPTETLRYALTDLDDEERKEGRLLSIGDVELALSDTQGNLEAGTIEISLSDVPGRPIGTRMAAAGTRSFQRDEIVILALTEAGRRATPSLTPKRLGRALIQDAQYVTPAVAKFSGTDPLFCDGGAFATDRHIPTWTYPSGAYAFAPTDIYSKPIPIILGEKADYGAIDPVTNLPSERGVIPLTFVGMDNLATGPGGSAEPWGRFNLCLFAIYQMTLYGSDFGGGIWGRSGATGATSDGGEPTSIITLDGSPDLSSVSVLGDMAITLYTRTGRDERQIIAKTATTVTINNSLAAADCTDVNWYITRQLPQRVLIDLGARQGDDVMIPGYPGYVRAHHYEDLLDAGETYRVTDCWVRGPLLDAHLAGEITLAANVVGVEDQGDGADGDGVPITDYFLAYLWWVENILLRNAKQPTGPGLLWPQADGDLLAYADGTYAVNARSFIDAQAQTVAAFGGRGFQVSACLDTALPVRDAIARWNTNGQCRLGINEHGQIFVWRLDALADPTTWPRVDHVSRVFGDVTRTNPQAEMENVVQGSCDWDADGARFRNPLVVVPSPLGIAHNKGVRKYSAVLEGTLVRDPAQWAFVLNERLAAQRDGPIYVEFTGDAGLMDYPLGSGISFTSIMGPGALGFVDQPLIILKKRFAIDSHLVTLTCLDPPGLIDPAYLFVLEDEDTTDVELGDETDDTALEIPPAVIVLPGVGTGPVVPGAVGPALTTGATRGAYSGSLAPAIVRVYTLADSGVGSLRAALVAGAPRIVVFEISGTIALQSQLFVTSPYITIAGQTAPSPGITVRNYGITIMAHDVLVQHVRVRVGDTGAPAPINQGYDGLFPYSTAAYNIVIDHCSISWVVGESTGTVSPPAISNITYWRCIISECLHFASNVPENSHGMVVYPATRSFAAIGNLFAHNVERNPECQEGSETVFVNNVVYDYGQTDLINYYPGASFFYQGGRLANAPFKASFAGNSYIKGPTMPTGKFAIYTYSGNAGSELYLSDNRVEGVTLYGNNMSFDPRVGSPPVSLAGITVRPSSGIEADVLAWAGARPLDRDAVDLRVVAQVAGRTGTYIASQNTVGGWPTLAVNTAAFVVPANPHVDAGAGYTNLEVALQALAAALEP